MMLLQQFVKIEKEIFGLEQNKDLINLTLKLIVLSATLMIQNKLEPLVQMIFYRFI